MHEGAAEMSDIGAFGKQNGGCKGRIHARLDTVSRLIGVRKALNETRQNRQMPILPRIQDSTTHGTLDGTWGCYVPRYHPLYKQNLCQHCDAPISVDFSVCRAGTHSHRSTIARQIHRFGR